MEEKQKEILGKVSEELINGKKKDCMTAVQKALDAGIPAHDILMDGLKAGMDVIGNDYGDKKIYLPSVLAAAESMYAGIDVLQPYLKGNGEEKGKGTILIGTVEGDMHDIGKNIVRIMLDGLSYNVIDLGRDVPRHEWIQKTQSEGADVVGCSTLMSTTLRSMEEVMVDLKENGLRDKVMFIIGGAATNATFAERIGADAWAENANDGVRKIAQFCAQRRE